MYLRVDGHSHWTAPLLRFKALQYRPGPTVIVSYVLAALLKGQGMDSGEHKSHSIPFTVLTARKRLIVFAWRSVLPIETARDVVHQ